MLPNLEPSFQTGCHGFKVISTCTFSALIILFFCFWTSSIIIHVKFTSNEPRVVYETKFGTSVPSLDTQHLRSPIMDIGSLISILKHIIFFCFTSHSLSSRPTSKMEIRRWTYAPILNTKFKATTVNNTHTTLIIIKCSNS